MMEGNLESVIKIFNIEHATFDTHITSLIRIHNAAENITNLDCARHLFESSSIYTNFRETQIPPHKQHKWNPWLIEISIAEANLIHFLKYKAKLLPLNFAFPG